MGLFTRYTWLERRINRLFSLEFDRLPRKGGQLLKEANQDLLLGGGYDQLQIFGNSYDVVLVTNLAEPWEFATQAYIRTIAAPLSGLGHLNSQCE